MIETLPSGSGTQVGESVSPFIHQQLFRQTCMVQALFFANHEFLFFFFSFRHPWEVHKHGASRVGANIAEHAIVSLAQMVERNPQILTPGLVPYLGSKLSVRWKYFVALLACMFAVDTLLLALSIFFLESEWDKNKTGFRRRGRGRGWRQDEQIPLANGSG